MIGNNIIGRYSVKVRCKVQKLKPGRKSEPGSLRSQGGITTLAIDKPTKAKIRELAGDMPLAHFAKGVFFGYIKIPGNGAQEVLPGQERGASKNTIASVKSDTEQAVTLMRGMSELLSGFFEPWVIFQSKDKQEASAQAIEARLRQLADIIKKARPEAEQKGLFNENMPG